MAYLRGSIYIFSDSEQLHIWSADGDDGWADSVWTTNPDLSVGNAAPSGVGIPQDAADEYVVMRFAELCAESSVIAVIDRAIERHSGNFGCLALQARSDELRVALGR